MPELATAFASGDTATAVEAIKTKVKELAKKKAVEIAQELKKKALCKKGIGSDCPKDTAAATTDVSAAGSDETSDDGGINFGIITMGKIDRVDDLGDTLWCVPFCFLYSISALSFRAAAEMQAPQWAGRRRRGLPRQPAGYGHRERGGHAHDGQRGDQCSWCVPFCFLHSSR
jgi:hypothetical protein